MLTVGADENADRSQHGGLQQGEAEGKAKALEAKSNARKIPRKVFLGFEEMHSAPSKSRRDSSKGRNWSWKCQLSSKICSILLILFAFLYASSYTCNVLCVNVTSHLLLWFDIWLHGVDMTVYGADNL